MTRLNCAVYTRKSSDEGLDQSFNSLDAQREAGEAYIQSQRAEGWRLVPTHYDDGGYSGGNIERPALQRLLDDVDAGRIDVVVVYKIDRLTRSLADFARIVERFDAKGVSFVSVTQAFNTTSSMGRLTLNVLLSFAQFEREVTGERIRDKIAASKAKGMWMGGTLPLGYDRPLPGTRTLIGNEAEAQTVRAIFERYLELGSSHKLAEELKARLIYSKSYLTLDGNQVGGIPFSRGALFHLLQNQLYLGKIVHKGQVHEGAHDAIVPDDLFHRVGARLREGRRRPKDTCEPRVAQPALMGRIFDATGEAMTPAFAYGRTGRVYRYYVSASLQQGAKSPRDGVLRRISVQEVDTLVTEELAEIGATINDVIRAKVSREGLELQLPTAKARVLPNDSAATIRHHGDGTSSLSIPITLPLRGGASSLAGGKRTATPDQKLVAALRRAHAMLDRDATGPVIAEAPKSPYERRVLRLAFLAPDIQQAILTGQQPRHLNLEYLVKTEIPIGWEAQRQYLRCLI
jgi:site-specific DNA recombinase